VPAMASQTYGARARAAGTLPPAGRRVPISVTPVGWAADADLSFSEWIEQGRRIGVAGRGAGWWIGDWVRYGATRYGGRYARAARVTGYDHKTLANMVYVASRFEISRRRENLSWSHHAELAALDVEEQERWLDRVEADGLSVQRLRQELAAEPSSARHRTAAPADDASPPAVCPNCGHRLLD
jgi:hypothetical protein